MAPFSALSAGNPIEKTVDPDEGIAKTIHASGLAPGASLDKKINDITYPLFATPSIKKKGQIFTMQIDTHGEEVSQWDILLTPSSNSAVTEVNNLPIKEIDYSNSDVTYKVNKKKPDSIVKENDEVFVSYQPTKL